MTSNFPQDEQLVEQLKELTLQRLSVMPEGTGLTIGSDRFAKSDLIEAVKKGNQLGKEIMTIQLEFLQDLASGEIYKDDDSYQSAPA